MNALDYRVRIAGERRERMRGHLIRTTLGLFAHHGYTGITIDEVTRAAGVARGTFYNYFHSCEELLAVVAAGLSDELMAIVDPLVNRFADPAERVSCGVRTCLAIGATHPQMAAFISRGGPAALEDSPLLQHYLRRDLVEGITCGRFAIGDAGLAFDLVVGTVVAGFHALWLRDTAEDYIPELACAVLMSLGVGRAAARKISRLPLPVFVVPEHSIIQA